MQSTSKESSLALKVQATRADATAGFTDRPGSRAAQLGVRKGDEVLQAGCVHHMGGPLPVGFRCCEVNLVDPEILFWRPAEQILPAIVGPCLT